MAGLLDWLNGSSGGMDDTGMGPPAPAQMGLLDRLGSGMSGGGPQIDPSMAASLGIDPSQMQRDRARATMMQFLAAAASATGNRPGHRAGIGDALSAGVQAAQQFGQQRQGQDINQLYMLQNMKRTQTADAAAQAQAAQTAALQKQMADPNFAANLPDSIKPYASILSALPPAQAVQMITAARAGDQKQAHDDLHEQGMNDRQDKQFAQQMALQRETAARQAAALGAPAKMDPLFGRLSPEDQDAAVRVKFGLDPKAGSGGATDAFGKADQQAAVKEAARLQEGLPALQDARDALQQMVAGLTPDPKTGAIQFGDTGRLAAMKAAQPDGGIWGGSASLTPDQQLFQKLSNRAILKDIPNLHTRLTNAELQFLQKSNPGMALDPATNRKLAQDMLDAANSSVSNAQQRYDYIQKNHSIAGNDLLGRTAAGGPVQMGGGQAAPTIATTTAPPEAPPAPNAVKGPDGQWYDPATGKRYVWKP